MTVTNKHNIPISLGVFLLHDTYPHSPDPFTLGVTTLIKPLKKIILASRVPKGDFSGELSTLIPSRLGTALHDAIEAAWKSENVPHYLQMLGWSKEDAERVRVNPEKITPNIIPVFTEHRTHKKVGKWTISGEFDFCGAGELRDYKSTGTYTVLGATGKAQEYRDQLSLYAWLNPDKASENLGHIDYIFTDWSGLEAYKSKKYPQCRMTTERIPLMNIETSQMYVENKLKKLEQLWHSPEEDLPECTNEELWAKPVTYKYYKNPHNLKRATKVYPTEAAANSHLIRDGSVGVVHQSKGGVKACIYCNALPICRQAQGYILSGALKLPTD